MAEALSGTLLPVIATGAFSRPSPINADATEMRSDALPRH